MTSKRAQRLLRHPPPLVAAHFRCAADRYDEATNPGGFINFGTAENFLVEAEVLRQLGRLAVERPDLHYGPSAGTVELRQAYLRFREHFFGLPPIPDAQVVVGAGASALLESLAFCLLDTGEAAITLAPTYTGFWHDLETRFEARLLASPALHQGRVDFDRLERDVSAASGVRVLLVCNPHNPSGVCLPEDDIRGLLELARRHDLSVIADEMYGNSVFGHTRFVSLLDPRFDPVGWRHRVHHVYGLAKDFGMSGFKVAFLSSEDAELARAVGECAYFHPVARPVQRAAAELLANVPFCTTLFDLVRQRLRESFDRLSAGLRSAGFGVESSDAGIFTLLDLSGAWSIDSPERELQAFEALLSERRVNITPGQFLAHPRPGVFRVCYAQSPATIEEFLRRMARPPQA